VGSSPQFVLEGVFGPDVGLAPPPRAPLAAQVLGVVGQTCQIDRLFWRPWRREVGG